MITQKHNKHLRQVPERRSMMKACDLGRFGGSEFSSVTHSATRNRETRPLVFDQYGRHGITVENAFDVFDCTRIPLHTSSRLRCPLGVLTPDICSSSPPQIEVMTCKAVS